MQAYLLGILNFLHEACVLLDARDAKRLGLRANSVDEIVKRYGSR